MPTNLASAGAAYTETPAVTGCPVHWVADLASSAPATPAPGRSVREIAETGTYTHTTEELTVGARLAWRHNTKCIGKLYWRGLTVRDFRAVTDPEAIVEGCLDHTAFVHNKGRIKPSITIFAPYRPGQPAAQGKNSQLISYAGHRLQDGSFIGDPNTAALTELAKEHGWAPEVEGRFDILPLVVETGDGHISVHEVPQELAHEVEWSWMIPPMSGSTSPNFHETLEDVFRLPNLIRRAPLS